MPKEFTSKKAQLKYAEAIDEALSDVRDEMKWFASAVSELETRIKTGIRSSNFHYEDKPNREVFNECNEFKTRVQGAILHLTGLDPENKSIPGFEIHYRQLCEKLEQLEPEALKTNPSEVAGKWVKRFGCGAIYVLIFLFLLVKCVF